ncbi:Exosome complex component CSL4 [Cyphellophora attinorum]|uniref:Exosome complex component CSL4 n=1 Tax=Cyphellophora attinorum TaxID=1664694 RepID=A0A0N1H985_9EURO|nr:Exosome complex component CSL4 [Phialophora attinorum]KPI38675.1 Exosome complex component CSL4 [Phialophora attinorum]
MATSTIACPGQVLAPISTHISGSGTHVYETNIIASLIGTTVTQPAASKNTKPTISIVPQTTHSPLPNVSSTVIARVIRVQARQLIASILPVPPTTSASTLMPYPTTTDDSVQYQAILRREDVRAFEKDKINMNESYRVGDIIRAVVISLGDERNYYISTAGDEFGVVVARSSEVGNAMVPASWREMRDVITGKGEPRKVAKPS